MPEKELTRELLLATSLKVLDLIKAEVDGDPDVQKAILYTAERIIVNGSVVFRSQERLRD